MDTFLQKSELFAKKSKHITAGAVFLLYGILTVYGGGSLWEMCRFWSYVLAFVYLPGRFCNLLLKTKEKVKEMDFALDLLAGMGLFLVLYCFAMRLSAKPLLLFAPPVLSLIYCLLCIKTEKDKNKAEPYGTNLKFLLFLALLLLFTFTTVIKSALPENVGDTLINQDLLWNVGNANSFTIRFLPEDIRYSGVQLHYHYLTEMFRGALSLVSGISAYNIIAFYIAPYTLYRVVECLYIFGKKYLNEDKKALIFTFSMFVFGCRGMWTCFTTGRSVFFNDNALHIITNINSQATAVIFLSIFGGIFSDISDKDFKVSLFEYFLWVASFFMLCFAKGPIAAVAVIGVVISVVWKFVQKQANLKGLIFARVLGGIFLVIYKFFFSSGAGTSMMFSLSATAERTIFGNRLGNLYYSGKITLWRAGCFAVAAITVFAALPLQGFIYAVGAVKNYLPNLFKLSGKQLWVNSQIAGGILAFFLFEHYAFSQVYFFFGAIFFLHLAAAENARLVLNKKPLKIAAGCFALIRVITQCFMYLNFIGSGARFLARNLGIIEKYPYSAVIKADDQKAMEYLKENTDDNILFATNRIDTSPAKGDGISNIYTAFSSRQSYMEGWAYALTNMGVPYYVVEQRRNINNRLFAEDTDRGTLRYLCRETGITHLVFSRQFPGSEDVISQTFECVYSSDGVRIYATGVAPMENHPLYQEQLSRYGRPKREE